MISRSDTYGRAAQESYDELWLRDDFLVDELDEEENITIYDVDTVLGFSVDILKVGVPLLMTAFFMGSALIFGIYF